MLRKAFFILLSTAVMVSCTEKEPDNGAGGSSWGTDIPEGNVEVTVLADRQSLLQNPLSGWVIYVPLIDDVARFWNEYENFQSSEGTVNVFDYGNVIYLRGSWTDFNPEEGVYIWDDGIDEVKYPLARSLRLFEEGAKERGLTLAFTLKVDSRDANAFCTPDFVKEKMDAKYGSNAGGRLVTKDGETVHTPGKGYFNFTLGSAGNERQYWSPYPDDPVFQEEYAKFINALAREYNDPAVTEFISGLGMGKWGEYHTCVYSTNDETPREAVFEWVTDVYANAFTKVPVVTNYHKFAGCIISEGLAENEPERCALTEKLMSSAISKGFSMRHDAFGMTSGNFGYAGWEKKFISQWRFQIPVLGEGGWIVTNGDYTTDDAGGYKTPHDLRQGEYDAMASAYVNMMDLRYDATYTRGETWSWFNDAYDLVEDFLEEGCYKVYPDRVTVPTKVTNGRTYTVQHRWLNKGRAYCPTNIKQYQGRYKVAFALLNTSSGEVVGDNVFYDEKALPHEWTLDSGRKQYEFDVTPDGIAPGNYCWAVGIVDTFTSDPEAGEYNIGIELAAQGDFTDDGWLMLEKVAVVD